MRYFFALIGCVAFYGFAFGQQLVWDTYYEKSGFTKTPTYDETIRYAKLLADHSDVISFQTFGVSPQGRPLVVLVVDNEGATSIEDVQDNKAIVLLQACIHAGESDGKDAGLMLLRDIVIGDLHNDILEDVTILFVPIFNVDGHERFSEFNRINQNGPDEMGWRATSQRLNLNRDYLKADTPEMQAMIRLYQQWLPDFYIDCHVTDGADYVYPLTYGLQMHGNLSVEQSNWLKNTYLLSITEKMDEVDQQIAPYMDVVEWHNPLKGVRAYYESPRYSGGYAAVNNRPALLIETHMLKDYKTRVSATYNMLLFSLKLISNEAVELKKLNVVADQSFIELKPGEEYTLTFKDDLDPSKLSYRGFEFEIEKSQLTGGNWYKYSNTPMESEIDFYSKVPDKIIELPEAYIIPVQWREIIDKLDLHNVKYEELSSDTTLEVNTYRFNDVNWNSRSFEGRVMVNYEVEPIQKQMTFPAGSKVVFLNQRAAQLAIHMLEPEAPDALVRWGFLNTIFEQKEYAESYVMERMAREMLANDPEMKEEFDTKMLSDSDFANNSWAILNWFYQKTPYWDEDINIYPIGRIFNVHNK